HPNTQLKAYLSPRSLALCTWGSAGATAYVPSDKTIVQCAVRDTSGGVRAIDVVEYVTAPTYFLLPGSFPLSPLPIYPSTRDSLCPFEKRRGDVRNERMRESRLGRVRERRGGRD